MKGNTFKALLNNRLDELTRLLRSGADINMVADDDIALMELSDIAIGDTLVHVALHKDNQNALEILHRFGANLNVSAQDGVTPLKLL